MTARTSLRMATRGLAAAAGVAAGAYTAYVGGTWFCYGDPARPSRDEEDPLLDRFMPAYDVVERHHTRVEAPAEVTLDVARSVKLSEIPLVRAIFKARELLLGSTPSTRSGPHGLLDEVVSLGWVVLSEISGREVVVGAVTKPWEANVTFRSVPPEEFVAFAEPDYVKIVWTLRADPISPTASIFRTETRAVGTDPVARSRFRRYWSFLSPGILLIRRMSLGAVRTEAERRARSDHSKHADPLSTDAHSP